MKTVLVSLAALGLATAPAFAMCGHDRMAQSEAPVEVARTMTVPDSLDMEATASIPENEATGATSRPVSD
ncbi:hypothetical protein E2A64_00575 [Pseudohoeflea suaedae]|uniref:Uncharacterized protein n=1 Tax=Pseudohoeflea suaedae TaxID=877384 RepID=A0A4R5PL72_9HYPH|nr:hypothetical protein [Pseudohoeflea suaedae]TDH37674.1 hypothetical protein E2A64_00575 [Pseudohoeflea suaedae]